MPTRIIFEEKCHTNISSFATPQMGRERAAKGVFPSEEFIMAIVNPEASLSINFPTTSGVLSLKPNPVPPVVIINSTLFSIKFSSIFLNSSPSSELICRETLSFSSRIRSWSKFPKNFQKTFYQFYQVRDLEKLCRSL